MRRRDAVFIVHPGALGDVLLALPAIRFLRRSWAHHRLGLLAGNAVGTLLKECGEIDQLFTLEGSALTSLVGSSPSPSAVSAWLMDTEVAVCWTASADQRLETVFARYGVLQSVIQSPHSDQLTSVHQADRFLETLGHVRQPLLPERWAENHPLAVPESRRAPAAARLREAGIDPAKGFVAIHPGSGSRHKNTSSALLAEFVRWCADHGLRAAILSGPADLAWAHQLNEQCHSPIPIFHGLDLRDTAALLCFASLYVGHDSGLTHMAAALHVPTLAVFGPTDPRRWAPRGDYVTVLTGGACACPEWSAVQQCEEKPCLSIKVEEMIHGTTRLLSRSPVSR